MVTSDLDRRHRLAMAVGLLVKVLQLLVVFERVHSLHRINCVRFIVDRRLRELVVYSLVVSRAANLSPGM